MIHRINVFLLCLITALCPVYVFAGAAEKWQVLENYYDSSTQKVHIEARKIAQQASNSSRYKVDVPVTPSSLGKTLKTMMWTGIAVAGVEALLEGIGWIIDPNTQSIWRYKQDSYGIPPKLLEYEYYAIGTTTGTSAPLSQRLDELKTSLLIKKAGSYAKETVNFTAYTYTSPSTVKITIEGVYCSSACSPATAYTYNPKTYVLNQTIYGVYVGPPQNAEKEYLSDSDLGNEVMGQGENTAPLGTAIATAYDPNNPASDAPAPKESNDALENANPEPETDPKGDTSEKPNVDTDGDGVPDEYSASAPSAGFEFTLPSACDWWPAACDFFLVQKADNKEIKQNQKDQLEQDKTFFEKVEEWFDWSKEEPTLENEELEIDEQQVINYVEENHVVFGKTCPFTPQAVSMPLGSIGSMDFETDLSFICDFGYMANPYVLGIGHLGALIFLLIGIRNGNA